MKPCFKVRNLAPNLEILLKWKDLKPRAAVF